MFYAIFVSLKHTVDNASTLIYVYVVVMLLFFSYSDDSDASPAGDRAASHGRWSSGPAHRECTAAVDCSSPSFLAKTASEVGLEGGGEAEVFRRKVVVWKRLGPVAKTATLG